MSSMSTSEPGPDQETSSGPRTWAGSHDRMEDFNGILGDVPSKHVDGESAVEGAKHDMQEDLQSVANLKGSKMWMVIGALALIFTAVIAVFLFARSSSPLTSGDEVKIGALSFRAPADWQTKEVKDSSMPETAKTAALINPDGSDVVRVSVMTIPKGEDATDGAKKMCASLKSTMQGSLKDGTVTEKASPIEGLQGCTLRAVGTPERVIEDLNKGQVPGKTSFAITIVQDKSDKIVMAFGAHTGATEQADGQVELSVMNQLAPQLSK